jgi:hypothetical protein
MENGRRSGKCGGREFNFGDSKMRSMNRVVNVALTVLLASVLATLAHAQAVSAGKFALPVETRWGMAVLPAGEYTYRLDSANLPAIIAVRGGGKSAMILVRGISEHPISNRSSITLLRSGRHAVVQSLDLGHLGRVFHYTLREGGPVLEASEPAHTERVPVVTEATK